MHPFFSLRGERALSVALAGKPLLALDFDGTLAPIVERPTDAFIPASTLALLERLGQYLPIAVVSGRDLRDLMARLHFMPHFAVGEHGAVYPDTPATDLPALEALRDRLRADQAIFDAEGILFEEKSHSLSLHYRTAHDPEHARARIEACVAGLDPCLRALGGKMVVNIVPAQAPNKGNAITRLMREGGFDSTIYLGDDDNDEPAFAAAARHGLGVRVGAARRDSRARFFLPGQFQVERLLRQVLALHA